jgi:Carboxypeptidase regulatory-like domain
MQLPCREPIGRRAMRVALKFGCGVLVLAMGIAAARMADADSGGADSRKTDPGKADSNKADSNKAVQVVASSRVGIEGFVKDEQGRPIARARVENQEVGTQQARRTLTDKNGHYTLDDLNESLFGFRILVRAAGHCPVMQEVKPRPPGKPVRVDITLSAAHALHGRVVDEEGKPVAGVEISTFGAESVLEPATHSGKDGRFEMNSLPPDAKFSLSKSGYTRLMYVPLKLDSSGLVTVVLQPMGVVRGRVVDAQSGKPLAHFRVWLNSPRRADGPYIPGGQDGVLAYPGKTFVSSDGTFTIPDLTNKVSVEVSVGADGYTKCVVPVVVAETQNEARPVAFALARIDAAKLATFSGHVLDHKGQPVHGANLRLITTPKPAKGPDDHDFDWYWITGELDGYPTKMPEMAGLSYCDQFLKAVSDSQGRFEFKDVLPGKHWQLAYWGPGVPRDRVLGTSKTVPGPAPPLTIKVPHPARVIVTIDRVKHPEAWQVGAQFGGSDLEVNLHGGQTRVEITDLAPGDYELLLFARPVIKDGAADITAIATHSIHLKPGETQQVRF